MDLFKERDYVYSRFGRELQQLWLCFDGPWNTDIPIGNSFGYDVMMKEIYVHENVLKGDVSGISVRSS